MDHGQRITNAAISTLDVLPDCNRVVVNGERAEAEVVLVQDGSVVQGCIGRNAAVRLDIASHSIDNRGQGLSGPSAIRILVDNVGADNGQVVHWVDTLVPMDVAGKVRVNVVLEQKWLKGIANVGLVGRDFGAVHRTMSHGKHPRSGGTVDGSKILSQPGELLVRRRVLPRTINVTWVKASVYVLLEHMDDMDYVPNGPLSVTKVWFSVGRVSLLVMSRTKGYSGLYGKSVSPSMEMK